MRSTIKTNHGREIRVFRWTPRAAEMLARRQAALGGGAGG